MALPVSPNTISFNNINQELGKASPYNQPVALNDSDVRTLFQKTTAGSAIAMSDGWGKSNQTFTNVWTTTYTGVNGNVATDNPTLFTVPANIYSLLIKCWGMGGAGYSPSTGRGGGGGFISGYLSVTPGQVIDVFAPLYTGYAWSGTYWYVSPMNAYLYSDSEDCSGCGGGGSCHGDMTIHMGGKIAGVATRVSGNRSFIVAGGGGANGNNGVTSSQGGAGGGVNGQNGTTTTSGWGGYGATGPTAGNAGAQVNSFQAGAGGSVPGTAYYSTGNAGTRIWQDGGAQSFGPGKCSSGTDEFGNEQYQTEDVYYCGGGSGYAGGGGGSQAQPAGGGSSVAYGFTSVTNTAGSGYTPGNSGDSDRGGAGVGGSAGYVYRYQNGVQVIDWYNTPSGGSARVVIRY